MSALLPVFGISRLRMETDGDGVTTLVGCLGCPLRCRLCINPHAQNPATPHRRLSAEQLVDELRVDGLYFSATGGGATFGGGEPLLHADFLAEFAEKRPADWRVRVETSLNADEAQLRRALDAVDGWIVDVKDFNPEIYRCYTGADNARVLLAQAMLGEPEVLLLDEPTAGLDPEERVRLRSYIEALGKNRIVIITTHITSDVETIADRILLIREGRLSAAMDTPDFLDGAASLEDAYLRRLHAL